jgi:hypothetical protein
MDFYSDILASYHQEAILTDQDKPHNHDHVPVSIHIQFLGRATNKAAKPVFF